MTSVGLEAEASPRGLEVPVKQTRWGWTALSADERHAVAEALEATHHPWDGDQVIDTSARHRDHLARRRARRRERGASA